MPLYDLLDRAAKLHPGRNAIVDGGTRRTYGDTLARVRRLAAVLSSRAERVPHLCPAPALSEERQLVGSVAPAAIEDGAPDGPVERVDEHPSGASTLAVRDVRRLRAGPTASDGATLACARRADGLQGVVGA